MRFAPAIGNAAVSEESDLSFVSGFNTPKSGYHTMDPN
jgi:hypothetical protein